MFGTDGIRGKANKFPMLPDVVLNLGKAVALYFSQEGETRTNRVIVGKDTRLSGYLFENAITAGLIAMGKEVFLLGPVPTPCLAFLTSSIRADFGIMVTASHNPFYDNGIKIFDNKGFKLNNAKEEEIKSLLDSNLKEKLSFGDKIGKATRLRGADGRYLQHIKSTFPNNLDLSDLKIVVDCAHGSSYKLAPDLLYELRAKEIIPLGIKPNGVNINDCCGSTYIGNTVRKLLEVGADVGISFDGDADRLIMVDEKGNIVDGDSILGIIASYWSEIGVLRNDTVVGTVISNLGLEKYLDSKNIKFLRVGVGDKNIIDSLKRNNYNLGGESSGHLILLDFNTNSDGILACLEVLKIMLNKKVPLSKLNESIPKIPQCINSLDIPCSVLDNQDVNNFIKNITQDYKDKTRIIVRKSGTENKIRILVEGEDKKLISDINKEINVFIKKYIALLDK